MTGIAIFEVLAFAEAISLFLQIALGLVIAAGIGWLLLRRRSTRGRW